MISMKNIRSILNCEQIVHYPGRTLPAGQWGRRCDSGRPCGLTHERQTLSTGRRVITCEYKEGGEGNQKSGLRKYRSI